MVLMTTVSFYTITAYTPTFGKTVLHLSQSDALLVTLCVGLSNLFWLPVMRGTFRPDRTAPGVDWLRERRRC